MSRRADASCNRKFLFFSLRFCIFLLHLDFLLMLYVLYLVFGKKCILTHVLCFTVPQLKLTERENKKSDLSSDVCLMDSKTFLHPINIYWHAFVLPLEIRRSNPNKIDRSWLQTIGIVSKIRSFEPIAVYFFFSQCVDFPFFFLNWIHFRKKHSPGESRLQIDWISNFQMKSLHVCLQMWFWSFSSRKAMKKMHFHLTLDS